MALYTTRGVKENIWYEELVDAQITIDQFFGS